MKFFALTSLDSFDPLPKLGEKVPARKTFDPRKCAVIKQIKPNLWLHPDGKLSYEPPEPPTTTTYLETAAPTKTVRQQVKPRPVQVGDFIICSNRDPDIPPGSKGKVLQIDGDLALCQFPGWGRGHNGGGLAQAENTIDNRECWWVIAKDLTIRPL